MYRRIIYSDNDGNSLWEIPDWVTVEEMEHSQHIVPQLQVEPPIIIFGKECKQRRNVGFFTDLDHGYNYSGNKGTGHIPLDSNLRNTLDRLNELMHTKYNAILVNYYADGSKYIGSHSDNQREILENSVASISLGPATRTFRLREKETNKILVNHQHNSGSLLVMEGPTFQKLYKHEIPKELKIKSPRLSYTFRHHV